MAQRRNIAAQICAHALFGFSLSMMVRRILINEPPFFPYAMLSFFLLSLVLVIATKPEYTIPLGGPSEWWWANNVKFGLSILLLSLSSMELIGLLCCHNGILNTIQNTEPPIVWVVCFLALSTCGFVHHDSLWRYAVPIGVLAAVLISTPPPLISFMFLLSCGAWAAKTYYWRNR